MMPRTGSIWMLSLSPTKKCELTLRYGKGNMTETQVLSRRPKSPTQERGEKRVADLLGAAEQLFASSGYETVTMHAIATLAGSSIGSLYQFFPNKESIGSALLNRYTDEIVLLLDQWQLSLPDTPMEFANGLISIVLGFVSKRPACRVLSETPSVVPAGSYGMVRLSAAIQDLLAKYDPEIKRSDLSAIALATWLIVRATVQGSRMVEKSKSAALRREMQQVLGSYLAERIGGGSTANARTSRQPR
jgi:AcrR family transcriptional regulator